MKDVQAETDITALATAAMRKIKLFIEGQKVSSEARESVITLITNFIGSSDRSVGGMAWYGVGLPAQALALGRVALAALFQDAKCSRAEARAALAVCRSILCNEAACDLLGLAVPKGSSPPAAADTMMRTVTIELLDAEEIVAASSPALTATVEPVVPIAPDPTVTSTVEITALEGGRGAGQQARA